MFIPEEPLVRSCGFFAKILRGPFQAGPAGAPILLPEESVHNMQTFYYWLIIGNQYLMEMFVDKFDLLIELWKFGDRIEQRAFQNEIMQIISESFKRYLSAERKESTMPMLLNLLGQAPQGSQLVEVIVEAMAYSVLRGKANALEIRESMLDRMNMNVYIGCLYKYAKMSTRELPDIFTSSDFMV